jgi:hypothetical protein
MTNRGPLPSASPAPTSASRTRAPTPDSRRRRSGRGPTAGVGDSASRPSMMRSADPGAQEPTGLRHRDAPPRGQPLERLHQAVPAATTPASSTSRCRLGERRARHRAAQAAVARLPSAHSRKGRGRSVVALAAAVTRARSSAACALARRIDAAPNDRVGLGKRHRQETHDPVRQQEDPRHQEERDAVPPPGRSPLGSSASRSRRRSRVTPSRRSSRWTRTSAVASGQRAPSSSPAG